MLTIRLKRIGRRNHPAFRIIVTEKHRGPKSGKYIENLGSYNPHEDKHVVDVERAKYWISQGAQVSDTVYNVFVDNNVVEGKKKNALPRKQALKKEQPEEVKATEVVQAPQAGATTEIGTEEAPQAPEPTPDGGEDSVTPTVTSPKESSEEEQKSE